MGRIWEEINHPTIDGVEIIVDQHEQDECFRESYEIVSLDITFSEIKHPDELVELGKWLIEQGTRIKKQYTPKGKPRKYDSQLSKDTKH
jgi:hypothetical protein